MEQHGFRLFIEQAASLPNYLGWRWALDGGRISSPEMLLRSALGACPDLMMT